MSTRVFDSSISHEVFQFSVDGTYPEDAAIVEAELSSSAINSLSELLEQVREDVKASIRELSRLSALDIDGWITQARQLRDDIEGSKRQSIEIKSLVERDYELSGSMKATHEKVTFLRKEVSFNDRLSNTLQRIQSVKDTVSAAQEAVIAGNLEESANLLKSSKRQQLELNGYSSARLNDLIQAKLADVESTLVKAATERWDQLIQVDLQRFQITIPEKQGDTSLETVAYILDALDLLEGKVFGFKKDIDKALLFPLCRVQRNGYRVCLFIGDNSISIMDKTIPLSTHNLFDDLDSIIAFLFSKLPEIVIDSLSEILMPSLVSRLLSGPLSFSVPPDLGGLIAFDSSISRTKDFAESLSLRGWSGASELISWANDAPNVWLRTRSNSSLHSVRQLLSRGLGEPRAVERVETQRVASDDATFHDTGREDGWNDPWSDDEHVDPSLGTTDTKSGSASKMNRTDDEDDEGAEWGFDDHEEGEALVNMDDKGEAKEEVDDTGDAWAWEDEEEQERSSSGHNHSPIDALKPQPGANSQEPSRHLSEREITLRESYFITALPEQILEIVIQAVDDADSLHKRGASSNPIMPASAGLLRLPVLLLSMYRASAPSFYSCDVNGNMYLYNDCLYVAEQLRMFSIHYKARSQSNALNEAGLGDEISILEAFGKGAYRKEMESQRTIIKDLLDNAEEFKNSTEYPFSEQCENAISSTVDRMRLVHKQFREVLSPSALRQSTGSLLTTVTNKIILNIEDMSAISAPESQRLAYFCKQIVDLQDLFLLDDNHAEPQAAVAAAVYTPTWWKFQYLAEVLESSLADIKYLWTEGELSLEFEPDEVVELIEALFAESEHRRNAILEIKRTSRRR